MSYANSESQFCSQCGSACGGLMYCSSCGALIIDTALPGTVPPPTFSPVKQQQEQQQQQQPPVVVTRQPKNVEMFQANATPTVSTINDMSIRDGDRLIYDFEKIACCIGEVKGLDPLVKNNMHPEVNRKGVSVEEWREWMSELDEIQRMAISVVGCLCIFCVPCCLAQSMAVALLCPISMDHPLSWLPCCYGDWYEALRNWMNKVNSILRKHGMYIKLFTYKPFHTSPRTKLYNQRVTGKDHNYEMSFLVLALTPNESRKLEDESWDHGINDGCTSGIGRCL